MKKRLHFRRIERSANTLVGSCINRNQRGCAYQRARRSRVLAAIASLGSVTGLFGTHWANAAGSETWTGATDNSWATTGNWTGTHPLPLTGDALFFNASTANLDLNNNQTTSGFNINGITYVSGSGAYVIGDGTTNPNKGNSFTLGNTITNASGVLQTIDDPFTMAAVRTISPEAGGIILAGNISGTNGGISETVSGILTLSGSNSYTGATTVSSTTLTLTNVNAVSASALTISGGTVNLFSNSGAVFNSAGVNLSGSATINVDNNGSGANNTLSLGTVGQTSSATETLTVTGGDGYGLALGAFSQTVATETTETIVNSVPLSIASFSTLSNATPKLSFTGTGTATITGAILQSGSGALALDRSGAAGVLILQGTSNMTGATTITNGTIQTAVTNAFGSTTGISIGALGTLQLLGDGTETFGNGTTAYPVNVTASGATIDVDQVSSGSGALLSLGAVTMNGTYILNTTGSTGVSLSLGAVSNNATSGSDPIAFNNTISSPGGLTIASISYPTTLRPAPGQIVTFSGSGSTTVTGSISENAASSADLVGVTVSGGTLNLNGTSTYLGTTTAAGGTLNLNGSLTGSNVSVNAGGTFLESSGGMIGGAGTSFTLNATGLTSTLAGSNSYTGSTIVTAGTLVASNPNALGAGIGSIGAAGTLKLIGDASGSFTNGTTPYPVSYASGATIDVDQASHAATGTTITLGAVTSSGSTNVLNITGSTGVSLSLGDVSNSQSLGTNSGSINIINTIAAPGALTIASVSYPTSTRTGTLGQLVTFGGSGTTTVTGSINQNPASATYTVGVAVSGGTLNLNGTSTYAGTTTVAGGTLNLNGSITGSSVSVTGGTLSESSGGVIGGTGSTLVMNAIGTTSNLAGANSFTGLTTITAGNLQISNGGGSALGSGTVAVSGGTAATLSGTGFNSGKVAVTSGSNLAPGTNGATPSGASNSNFGSAGVLTLGSTGGLALTSATLDFDLASSPSGTSDEISTTALSLTSVSTAFNGLGSSVQLGTPYVLIHYTGTATGSGAAAFSNANTTFVGTLAGSNYAASYTLDTVNDNVDVTFSTATPEPASLGMLALGGLTLMRRRRRRIDTSAAR